MTEISATTISDRVESIAQEIVRMAEYDRNTSQWIAFSTHSSGLGDWHAIPLQGPLGVFTPLDEYSDQAEQRLDRWTMMAIQAGDGRIHHGRSLFQGVSRDRALERTMVMAKVEELVRKA